MKFETVRIRWRFRFTVTQKFCYRDVTTSFCFQEDLASVRLSERTDVAKTNPAKTRRAWSGDVGGGGKGRIASSLPNPRVSVSLSFFGTWKRLRRPLHNYHMKANGKKHLCSHSTSVALFCFLFDWLSLFLLVLKCHNKQLYGQKYSFFPLKISVSHYTSDHHNGHIHLQRPLTSAPRWRLNWGWTILYRTASP